MTSTYVDADEHPSRVPARRRRGRPRAAGPRFDADPHNRRTTAILFPGQGSQTPEMRELVARVRPDLLQAAIDVVGEDPFPRVDDGTNFAQPAIFCASLAGWASIGSPVSELMAGHSLGELGALVAAGALDERDALRAGDAARPADAGVRPRRRRRRDGRGDRRRRGRARRGDRRRARRSRSPTTTRRCRSCCPAPRRSDPGRRSTPPRRSGCARWSSTSPARFTRR